MKHSTLFVPLKVSSAQLSYSKNSPGSLTVHDIFVKVIASRPKVKIIIDIGTNFFLTGQNTTIFLGMQSTENSFSITRHSDRG